MRLGGFVLVAAVFGATACIRLLPSSVWWRIRGGAPAVPLCDGGVFVDDDDETLKGPPGSEDVIPGVEFKSCMQLMQAEYPYDWNEREFSFEFSTNDAGVVEHLCARRVPSAPAAPHAPPRSSRGAASRPASRSNATGSASSSNDCTA